MCPGILISLFQMSLISNCFVDDNLDLFKKLYEVPNIVDSTTYLCRAMKFNCGKIFEFLLEKMITTCGESSIATLLRLVIEDAIIIGNLKFIKVLIPLIDISMFRLKMYPEYFDENIKILELLLENGIVKSSTDYPFNSVLKYGSMPINAYDGHIFMLALHFRQIRTVRLIVTKFRCVVPSENCFIFKIPKVKIIRSGTEIKNVGSLEKEIINLLRVNNLMHVIRTNVKLINLLKESDMASTNLLVMAINNLKNLYDNNSHNSMKEVIYYNYNFDEETKIILMKINKNFLTNKLNKKIRWRADIIISHKS